MIWHGQHKFYICWMSSQWASQVAQWQKKKKKKNPPANVRDMGDIGSIPGLRRSPGGGNSNPLQYSCLDNPMDRGACGLQSPWGCKESDTSEPVSMRAKSVPPYVELQLMLKF